MKVVAYRNVQYGGTDIRLVDLRNTSGDYINLSKQEALRLQEALNEAIDWWNDIHREKAEWLVPLQGDVTQ